MSAPENLQVLEGYARYRPVAHVSLQEALDLASRAIALSREQGIDKLLFDTTGLTGFANPTTTDRYFLTEQLSLAGMGTVKLALVARADFIDPERFGVTVARNRGLRLNVFATESEALEWLLSSRIE